MWKTTIGLDQLGLFQKISPILPVDKLYLAHLHVHTHIAIYIISYILYVFLTETMLERNLNGLLLLPTSPVYAIMLNRYLFLGGEYENL